MTDKQWDFILREIENLMQSTAAFIDEDSEAISEFEAWSATLDILEREYQKQHAEPIHRCIE